MPVPIRTCSSADRRARLCEGRGRTFKSCQVHQFKDSYGVAELERRESLKLVYVGSNPTSVASLKSLTRVQWSRKAARDGLIIRRRRFKSCLRNQARGPPCLKCQLE